MADDAGQWTSVADQIAAAWRLTPSAPALECEGARLSYAQLGARADALAHALGALGAATDVPIAVCCARSPALVVALLGVLRAGAGYVPLEPSHPPRRLRHMLVAARVAVAVVDAAGYDALRPAEGDACGVAEDGDDALHSALALVRVDADGVVLRASDAASSDDGAIRAAHAAR